jgi:hypothetical protein
VLHVIHSIRSRSQFDETRLVLVMPLNQSIDLLLLYTTRVLAEWNTVDNDATDRLSLSNCTKTIDGRRSCRNLSFVARQRFSRVTNNRTATTRRTTRTSTDDSTYLFSLTSQKHSWTKPNDSMSIERLVNPAANTSTRTSLIVCSDRCRSSAVSRRENKSSVKSPIEANRCTSNEQQQQQQRER